MFLLVVLRRRTGSALEVFWSSQSQVFLFVPALLTFNFELFFGETNAPYIMTQLTFEDYLV